jgi:hypothetical protein
MLLENLARLNQAKANIRTESMTALSNDSALLDHAAIVELWMDAILFLSTKVKATTDDDLTIQYIGVRLFNSTACALDLILSGFYQAATPHVRDVMEINFLLTDFCNDRKRIKRWRESDERDRKKFFQPVHVRSRIDDADGFREQKRKNAYDTLSKFGVHPTPDSNALLAKNGLVVAGPFYDFPRLKALLEELVMRLSTGTLSFSGFFTEYDETLERHRTLLAKTDEWRAKYLASSQSVREPPSQ